MLPGRQQMMQPSPDWGVNAYPQTGTQAGPEQSRMTHHRGRPG
jgi:hypothetical protein